MTKICTECGIEKELNEFYKDSRAVTKTTSKCKECINKYQKDRSSITEYKKNTNRVYEKLYEIIYYDRTY